MTPPLRIYWRALLPVAALIGAGFYALGDRLGHLAWDAADREFNTYAGEE